MGNIFFKVIARCNKALLPSLSKKQVDISKASKSQLLLLAWRTYITMRAL
ncbi:MAG: SsrA-binding protein [Flavobacteriaceae bacterium]|nr:SsrA-binding protein [Flavobacteriaceae bacterium]